MPLADEALELAYADTGPATDRQRDALARCLTRLGERVGKIIHHHYRDGMALADVAETLEMSVGAVKVAIHRARMQLKDCVRNFLERKEQA
jgi:RNA polymerase sigma factor (sigma-70 family)